MYKPLILMFVAAMLLNIHSAEAQLFAGAEGITIKSGTTFSLEGLVLQPSTDLVLDNLLAEKSAVATALPVGNSIGKVYSFSRALTFSGTVGLFYQTDELNGNTPSLLALFHKNQFAVNTYGSVLGGTTDVWGKYVSQNFTSLTFSHITAANGAVPLPVSLISFTAKTDGNYAKLQWKTVNEVNHKGFEIWRKAESERTKDQIARTTFVKIGEVSALVPRNPQLVTYTFTDKTPANGTNYYQLVQIDNNGTATELGIRTVNFGLQTSDIRLYPNLTKDKITLTFTPGKYQSLSLRDNLGRVLQQRNISTQSAGEIVNLSAYPTGVYFVRLQMQTASIVKKVIKQ